MTIVRLTRCRERECPNLFVPRPNRRLCDRCVARLWKLWADDEVTKVGRAEG